MPRTYQGAIGSAWRLSVVRTRRDGAMMARIPVPTHQPLDPLAACAASLGPQGGMDARAAIASAAVVVHTPDCRHQLRHWPTIERWVSAPAKRNSRPGRRRARRTARGPDRRQGLLARKKFNGVRTRGGHVLA